MSKYKQFVFRDYSFDTNNRTLTLSYGFDEELNFVEKYKFDFEYSKFSEEALDRAFQTLFFMAGVSYYKAFLSPSLMVSKGQIDNQTANFLNKTYQKGLGEFFYVNKLDPNTPIAFPVNSETLNTLSVSGEGVLIGIGGGKDSLVSVELLREQPKVATWSLNHKSQLEPLINNIDLPHFWVEREIDSKLMELKESLQAYNGHVPISAIFACVGTIVSILAGYRDSVVSNESTASDPSLEYQGVEINHQYSKSLEFELDYQKLLNQLYGKSIRYYSLLRPFTELRVAELFANLGFEKYKNEFTSCNRAFVHGSQEISWCGECPKCAFVFLILTPFVERLKLEALWGGKNLLLDPNLEPTYKQLLGIEGDKPLDCVGEIKESRAAMRLAQEQYPELANYKFDIPDDYDWRRVSSNFMPPEIYELLSQSLNE